MLSSLLRIDRSEGLSSRALSPRVARVSADAGEQVHQILHANTLQRAHRSRDFLAQSFVRAIDREIIELRHDFVPGERPRREPGDSRSPRVGATTCRS